MSQIQGSKYDPEGEYVRQWLPELARMPTEWIHHPWDAPLTVLKAAGVELGLNYPKPIIDIDSAQECLTEAIFKMWEMEATAKAGTLDSTIVVDNSPSIENSGIPKVILEEKAPCPTISSNDQKVPSVRNCNNGSSNRKRPKHIEEEKCTNKFDNHMTEVSTSKRNEDLCSTAESSASKKQNTSRISFSVPQSCSSSDSRPVEYESPDINQSRQERIDLEQSCSGTGK